MSAMTLLLPSPPVEGSWTIGVPVGAWAMFIRTRIRSAGSVAVVRGASTMSTVALSASVGSSFGSAAGTVGRRCSVTVSGSASLGWPPAMPSLTWSSGSPLALAATPAERTLRRTSPARLFAAAGVGTIVVVGSGSLDVTTSWPPTGLGFFVFAGVFAAAVSFGTTGVESAAGTVPSDGRTTICVPVAWTSHAWCAAFFFLCVVTVAVVPGAIRARPESSGMPTICGGTATSASSRARRP